MNSIVVKYKTKQSYCSCCDQELPKPKLSKDREFEISKESTMSWADWQEAVEEYPEDLERMFSDFTYEVIRFYAVDSNERIVLDDSEIDKVRDFILEAVKAAG